MHVVNEDHVLRQHAALVCNERIHHLEGLVVPEQGRESVPQGFSQLGGRVLEQACLPDTLEITYVVVYDVLSVDGFSF